VPLQNSMHKFTKLYCLADLAPGICAPMGTSAAKHDFSKFANHYAYCHKCLWLSLPACPSANAMHLDIQSFLRQAFCLNRIIMVTFNKQCQPMFQFYVQSKSPPQAGPCDCSSIRLRRLSSLGKMLVSVRG
jgi:hypothetical protein